MGAAASTCWTLIEGARRGDEGSRAAFAARYLPAMRAYLVARWRGTPLLESADDAVQETFLDLFRRDGALARLDPTRPGGFRAFLFGVVRTVALHVETRRARERERAGLAGVDLAALEAREPEVEAVFDRAWAVAVVKEALALQRERAGERGEDAARRTEILRLRFGEDMPLREVARRWEMDPDRVHREYARARREFREALEDVVAGHRPGDPEGAARECADLLGIFEIPPEENRPPRGPGNGRDEPNR